MSKIIKKTNIKGLYITGMGEIWRKDCKRVINPNKKGKIRYNGKLYNFEKLIDYSEKEPQKNNGYQAKPKHKSKIYLSELKKQGFQKTKIKGLYITKNGICYNITTKRELSNRNGKINISSKTHNVAKIIIETFKNIPIRKGQINFINGNKNDFNIENIEYKSTDKQTYPSKNDLIKCIRLYFEVDKNLKLSNINYKFYLFEIIKMRGFNLKYQENDFKVFIEYFNSDLGLLYNNQKTVFKKFNYSVTNGKNAINKYLNLLIKECISDFETGILKLKDYKNPIKPKKLKYLQTTINENNLTLKKPFKKENIKETLNNYFKETSHLKTD